MTEEGYTHGGELYIISSHCICKEHVGTVFVDVSSIEMMQDYPLHVLGTNTTWYLQSHFE
jgi:hypothetical protein